MTRDDIIRMAREADLTYTPQAGWVVGSVQRLERFAALVAAHERAACAAAAEFPRTVQFLWDGPPPRREWHGLTDEEQRLFSSWLDEKPDAEVFAAIEKTLREKNDG